MANPSHPILVETTALRMASASRILRRVPAAISIGAIATSAELRYGRTSGTVPVTVTPGSFASFHTSGEGLRPTICQVASGRRFRMSGQHHSLAQRHGDFSGFDRVKRTETIDEFFAALRQELSKAA